MPRTVHKLKWISLSLLFFGLSIPCLANARITGSLSLEDGSSPVGISVVLVPIEAGSEKAKEVNKKGRFTLYPVVQGTYSIRFEPAEYALTYIRMEPRSPSGQIHGDIKEETLQPGDSSPSFQIIDLMRMKLELRAKKVEGLPSTTSIAQAKSNSPKLKELNDLYNQQDFEGLVAKAQELIAEDPSLGGAHYMLAVGLWKTEDFANADIAMAKAIELDPEQQAIHGVYGAILTNYGQHLAGQADSQAVDIFKRAAEQLDLQLAQTPDATNYLISKIIALEGAGEKELTIVTLDQLITKDPNQIRPYLHKAELLTALGKREEAMDVLSQMPVDSAAAADQLYNIAVEIYDEGRNEEAVAAIERAIEAKPDEPLFYRLKGRALIAIGGRDQEGVEALKKYLSMVPEDDPAAEPDRMLVESLGGT